MRLRLRAPRGQSVKVRYLDSLHGALVNAWTSCGVRGPDVVGPEAGNWSFGAVGTATHGGFLLKSVVVGAKGGPLEATLPRLSPETFRKTSMNGDVVDLSAWDVTRCGPSNMPNGKAQKCISTTISRSIMRSTPFLTP